MKFSVRAHASETALKNIAVATADTLQDVMRFDHNPQLTRLTNTIGDGALSNIPTRGACCIDLGMGVLIENMWKLHGKNRCVEVSPKAHSLNSELLLALGAPRERDLFAFSKSAKSTYRPFYHPGARAKSTENNHNCHPKFHLKPLPNRVKLVRRRSWPKKKQPRKRTN